MLAKARAAERALAEDATSLDDELDAVGRAPVVSVDAAVDFVPGPPSGRAPSAPFTPSAPRELSPTLVAVFSALVGIATIASITALFMSLESRTSAGTSAAATVDVAPSPSVASVPEPKTPRQARTPKAAQPLAALGCARRRQIPLHRRQGRHRFLPESARSSRRSGGAGYRVLAAMRGVVDLNKCKRSDRFQALLERGTNKLFALEYLAGPEDVYQAKENDGRLTGGKLDLKIERGQVLGALSYDGSSFDRSADVAGFDPGLSKVVQRALDGQMSLDELESR